MLNLQHFHQLATDREDSVRLLNKPSMRGIRASIVEKYSEKAHFVYELLQNADDVNATEVRFILRKNGLYFVHNGTVHFTVTAPDDMRNIGHLNAITAIGDTSKLGFDTPKIGKFGIGFKAVFQYTNTPHIYDPHISFKIRDLIVPVLLEQEAHPLRKNDETLFYFPFDRLEKSAQEAVDEIEDKLKNLLFPLIFLRNLKKISWESDNGTKGTYILTADTEGGTHLQTVGKKSNQQRFLRFSKSLPQTPKGGDSGGNVGNAEKAVQQNAPSGGWGVQAVFLLDEDGDINPYKKYPAFCFFPTKVMAGFRFLIHAPFLLSDSREGIRQKESWNEQLVQHLAELIADSAEILVQKMDFDSILLFQSLPFERSDLDGLFAPIADALLQRFHQKTLLLASDGSKVAISNAYLAENKNTQSLCDAAELENILGQGARWIFPDLTHNTKLWHTVKTHLTANKNIVTTDWLSAKLDVLKVSTQLPPSVLKENKAETSVLKPEIIEIWDTLSEDERLKLMQEAEPEATYAVWDSVQDFDLVGLDDYLQQPISLESSLFLWDFLINCFETQVFNIQNFYGNYTFAYKTEQNVSFDALYWRRLKSAVWLFGRDGKLQDTPSVKTDFLHEKYTLHPLLLQYLFAKKEAIIDRFAYLTDEEKRAIEVGKRFLEQGFSTEDFLELRRIKASKSFFDKDKTYDTHKEKLKKERKKFEKSLETEENEQTSSEALLKKKQELREELEAELQDKIEQLIEVEDLKRMVQESARYSMAWFKALLRLEYLLAYEKQEKDRSFQIHFDKVEHEQGTNKTILLKRPSQVFPYNIEDAGDITLKLQLEHERRNLAVEVVSIKDAGLRAKLKTPEEIADVDFSKIRGATLEIQNTIFVLEELTKAFDELELPDEHNVQTNLQTDIRFIFGPPGTGKTTYLAHEEIQPAMLADDPLKVLVLTPTNKAADVLVQKVQKICGESPDWLIRFGTTSEIGIENAGLLKDSNYDISGRDHFCVVTTITRFPYDGFNFGSRDYKFKNIAWDVIIVDEASMIGVAYMAYLLQQQTQAQFVIGGDPFQIEPVVFAEDWKGENIYSMVRLDAFDPVLQRERLFPHPYKVQNLTTQYRSINTIGALYSHFAYDSILRHKRFKEDKKELKLPNLPLKDINIIQFPAHKLESIYRPQLLHKSHFQIYSALLTVELTQYIARELQEHHPDEIVRIGIICPYKAQATLVDKVLSSLHINYKNIRIQTGTIHSFQGDECNIVLCLFNPPPTLSKSPNAFLNKKNILNVAVSRAKDYLILLMPDDNTVGIENLYQIQRLRGIIQYYLAGVCQRWTSAQIEEILFGAPDFLYENTFATTHQSVNVYTEPEKKYEIRVEETAIDVQVNLMRS